jgi:hypothetical protein
MSYFSGAAIGTPDADQPGGDDRTRKRVDPLAPPTERNTSSAPVPDPISGALNTFWAPVIEPIRQIPMP